MKVLRRRIRLSMDLCLLERLGGLHTPTLLIHGAHDPVVRLDWICDAVPKFSDATLSVLSDCSHIPQLENPDAVIEQIGDFLS